MKSNCKQIKEAIRKHILEYYSPEELKNQVNAIKCSIYPTDYSAVYHMVTGGCFLIYHNDVKIFLNNLGINPNNKEYNSVKSWELYCHLIARDAQLILKHV